MSGQTLPAGHSGVRPVLLVTYYFPPAGGSGVQRMLKITKYLPQFGWKPLVLTVREDADYPVRDTSLWSDVPEGTTVLRTRITEFYRLYRNIARTERPLEGSPRSPHEGLAARMLRTLRAGFLLPDGRIGWLPHAVGPGTRLARRSGARAILSSGPPFTANLIGGLVRRRTGLPWVQDFRDPWTRAPYYPVRPRLSQRLDEWLEHWTLRNATRTLAVNRTILEDFRARYPDTESERLITLTNGFDEEDFAGIERRWPDRMTLVHTGTLYAARDPHALRAALSDLCREEEGFAGGVELVLAGRTDPSMIEAFRVPPLDRLVRDVGYLPHAESLRLLRAAHLCLLFIGDEPQSRGMLTGKLFEYLGSGTAILAIAPEEGEAAEVIRRCRAGKVFAPADGPGIREWLRRCWRRFRAGDHLFEEPDTAQVARFGRRSLAGQLAAILDSVTEGVSPRPSGC